MPTSTDLTDQASIRVINLEVTDDLEGTYRFLIDGRVKYVDIDGDVYASLDDMCCVDDLIPLLPRFPPGTWNHGIISRSTADGQPYFSVTEIVEYRAVATRKIWHPRVIDLLTLDLEWSNNSPVRNIVQPIAGLPAVAKFAHWPWFIESIEDETEAYSWLPEQDIFPRFLGHLTEHGRVTGFIVERIAGRHAGPGDLEACRESLGRLHSLGIKHGDVNRFNFIIRETDNRAVVLDLATARKCDDPKALAEELKLLEEKLVATDFWGGSVRLD